jgi:hypothetical protein
LAEFEITLKLWIIDDDPVSIAQMCQDIADNYEEAVALDFAYYGIDPSKIDSGLINVSFKQVFSSKGEKDD